MMILRKNVQVSMLLSHYDFGISELILFKSVFLLTCFVKVLLEQDD